MRADERSEFDRLGIHRSHQRAPSPRECTGNLPVDLAQAHQELIDAAIETDEALMEKYLSGSPLEPEELSKAMVHAIAEGSLVPIFFMSAKKDIGVGEFMDALAEFAPSPVPCPFHAQLNGEERVIEPRPDGPVVARVFKTRIDPFVARMSFARIYSGTIRKDASLRMNAAANRSRLIRCSICRERSMKP